MLQGIIDLWFVFVILSVVFTTYDIRNTPVSWVQKLGWILVVIYTGPFGLFYYLLTCRSPGKNWHALYTQANWKQAVNSEVHCVAGDATGIIVAAIILSFSTIPMGIELVIEYVASFISGWFIFQAGMMISMYKSYRESLFKTFFPETVSMNLVMVGMIPTMYILMHYIPNSGEPSSSHFWFVMAMATLAGAIIAYPINFWLVRNKLKHGCMTLPEKDNANALTNMETSNQKHEEMDGHDVMSSQHEMHFLSFKKQAIIIVTTFAILAVAILITLYFLPMGSETMSSMPMGK
ncbi:MAG: DUF4396 domain-containing protein [Gammaproteobacteria bacterium]